MTITYEPHEFGAILLWGFGYSAVWRVLRRPRVVISFAMYIACCIIFAVQRLPQQGACASFKHAYVLRFTKRASCHCFSPPISRMQTQLGCNACYPANYKFMGVMDACC